MIKYEIVMIKRVNEKRRNKNGVSVKVKLRGHYQVTLNIIELFLKNHGFFFHYPFASFFKKIFVK